MIKAQLAHLADPELAGKLTAALTVDQFGDLPIDGTASTLSRDPVMKTLCTGTVGAPVLGTPITISANPASLTDLTVLVSYTVT